MTKDDEQIYYNVNMKVVIYIDVLIAVNLFVNYLLLLATSRFISKKVRFRRMFLGAFVGALFSLIIFFDTINFFLLTAIKLMMALILVILTFGFTSKPIFIKSTLIFFGINFLFAGFIVTLWLFAAPAGMQYKNGAVYFNISAIMLLIVTTIAYFLIRLIEYILSKQVKKEEIYKLKIEYNNKSVTLNAFYDTGNSMTDLITGESVSICYITAIQSLLSDEIINFVLNGDYSNIDSIKGTGMRILPYNVVGGNGLMLCFSPDNLMLSYASKTQEIKGLIGISGVALSQGEFDAILNKNVI